MSEILTEQELMVISDAATRPTMLAWLQSNGIPYLVARSGWPRVHRKAIERALGVVPDEKPAKDFVFNFDALK